MGRDEFMKLAVHAEAIVRHETRREMRVEVDDLLDQNYALRAENERLLDALMSVLPLALRGGMRE